MTLDIPTGDERTYRHLIEDARKRIPALADEWSDHNVHDPGMTILETLAWVTETYSYQLDRVDDRHLRAYLRLVGERPSPPVPATVRLSLSLPEGRSNLVLDGGSRVVAGVGTLDEREFSTTESVALTDASIARVVSEYRGRRTDNSTANEVESLNYLAFGPRADADSALYLGFRGDPFAENRRLDLWVDFHEDGLKPAADSEAQSASRHEDWWSATVADPERTREADGVVEYRPSVAASWEFCADYDNWWTDDGWEAFAAVEDGTTDLYHGGRIGLTLGDSDEETERRSWPSAPGAILDQTEPYYWVRCTLTPRNPRSEGSLAPRSDTRSHRDDERPPSHDLPPQFDAIRLNVVEAIHATLVETPTRLHRVGARSDESKTTARPGQAFAFPSGPVLEAEIATCPADRAEHGRCPEDSREWDVVSHFDASGSGADHVRLDETRGTITFGDGIRGRIPLPDRVVEARRYLLGGGREGNVPRSAAWGYVPPDDGEATGERTESVVAATALADATGGKDAESPRDALSRVRRTLADPARAVTLSDYRHLALETPGLRVGRAEATLGAGETPDGCVGSNEVHVVVVPFSTRDRPEPSDGFLKAVRCHLRRHAVLTDRVVVESPDYVGVGADVELRFEAGTETSNGTAAVVAALESFLAPLSVDGGDGWPFGRPLYPSEVYEVVESVSGVDCVLDVRFTVEGPGRLDDEGVVHIPESGLFYSLSHDVRARRSDDSCGGGWT